MTARQVFEAVLIETNKVKAAPLLLEDYNYFMNSSVNQIVNRGYNLVEMNQQLTDDLRVLKSTAVLTPTITTVNSPNNLLSKTYEVFLPDDYLHILNCLVEYTVHQNFKCYNENEVVQFGAKRLTADMYPQIIHNYYHKPSYKNPYYYLNNVTTDVVYPTAENLSNVTFTSPDNVERIAGNRYGNKSRVKMEIRYGKDNGVFELSKVYVDYLKAPQFIRLTQEQLDAVEDNSQVLEFPDYVCQEIIKTMTAILLENASDPRLQTHIPINTSIASPAQEQPKSR